MPKICTNCNESNEPDATFCFKCFHLFVSQIQLWESLKSDLLGIQELTERYLILKTIKTSGNNRVFIGVDNHFNKVCTIRELSPKKDENLEREVKLLSRFNHPNISKVYDYFKLNNKFYLIIEFTSSHNILSVMEEHFKNGFPEEDVVNMGIQICNVLSYLHSRNLPEIYCNFKLDNFILRRIDNTLFLFELDILRLISDQKPESSIRCITAGYTPPEQKENLKNNIFDDIYSIGATMYYLLKGSHNIEIPSGSIKKNLPHISFYIEEVIQKTLDHYYESLEELTNALLLWKNPFDLIQHGFSDMDNLVIQLKAQDTKTRINAVRALVKFEENKSTVALMRILYDGDYTLKKEVISALGSIGHTIALDELLCLINDPNVRQNIINSLGKIKWPEDSDIVFNCLKDLFEHEDSQVRLFAYSRQAEYENEKFYPYLIKGLKDTDNNIRKLCAHTLADIGNPEALSYMKKAAGNESVFSIGTKMSIQKSIKKLENKITEQKNIKNDKSLKLVPSKKEEALIESKKIESEKAETEKLQEKKEQIMPLKGIKKLKPLSYHRKPSTELAIMKSKTILLPKEEISSLLELEGELHKEEILNSGEPRRKLLKSIKKEKKSLYLTRGLERIPDLEKIINKEKKIQEEVISNNEEFFVELEEEQEKSTEIKSEVPLIETPEEVITEIEIKKEELPEEKTPDEIEIKEKPVIDYEDIIFEEVDTEEEFIIGNIDEELIFSLEQPVHQEDSLIEINLDNFNIDMESLQPDNFTGEDLLNIDLLNTEEAPVPSEQVHAPPEEKNNKDIIPPAKKEQTLNCWQFMKCGKERFCPAYPMRGKKCAHVVGNIEGKKARGPLASSKNCIECPFFNSEHYEGQKS